MRLLLAAGLAAVALAGCGSGSPRGATRTVTVAAASRTRAASVEVPPNIQVMGWVKDRDRSAGAVNMIISLPETPSNATVQVIDGKPRAVYAIAAARTPLPADAVGAATALCGELVHGTRALGLAEQIRSYAVLGQGDATLATCDT